MTNLLSIAFFLISIYGLGYALTRFLDHNKLETTLIRLGIGLGAFPVLGVLLNFIGIPLSFWIFLLISLTIPIFDLINKRFRLSFQDCFKFNKIFLILIIIFAASIYIYCSGAFQYPWLEDDDPWTHAAGIQYIAVEKNLNVEPGVFHYINPYPPGYDLLLGILHQINPSIYWTMKFFNGFIISLGFLFFYCLVYTLTECKKKAIIATLFLLCIPCYLSHFIWAHSLIVTLFFPAFYTLWNTQKDKRFILPSSIVIAGIFLVQPTQSIKFICLVFIMITAYFIIYKTLWKKAVLCLMIGGIISLLWWGPVLYQMKAGTSKIALRKNTNVSNFTKDTSKTAKSLFSPGGGTATRKYSVHDYLHASGNNLINNPVGIGISLSALAVIGLFGMLNIFKLGNAGAKLYSIIILFWLVFTFIGMNSKTFNLPIGLFAFRFWMLFAIPVSILAMEGTLYLINRFNVPLVKSFLTCFLLASVISTSGIHKSILNRSIWPWGVYWKSQEELKGYTWLRKNLKANSKVFSFTDNLLVIGHDMHANYWDKEYKKSLGNALEYNTKQLHQTLKQQGFQYLIVSERDVIEHGSEKINTLIEGIESDQLFEGTFKTSNAAVVIYKIL